MEIKKQMQLLKIFLRDRSSFRLAVGVIFGVSFSVSVILSTIGIMDGFVETLQTGLRTSSGDMSIHSQSGFFKYDIELKTVLKSFGITDVAPIVITEGFLMAGDNAKGVMIRGVDKSFSKVSGISLDLQDKEIAIGKEVAKIFNLNLGNEVVLAFANGNQQFSSLPNLVRLKIAAIVDHKIYQKDIRYVYMKRTRLQKILKLGQRLNILLVNTPDTKEDVNLKERVLSYKRKLARALPIEMVIRPYWAEFSFLLEAVEVEKIIIGLILQLVVLISMFNVLAFIIFVREKHLKEIFLLKALGLSNQGLYHIWAAIIVLAWPLSSILAIMLVKIFNYCLESWSIFQLPGDIYTLNHLSINLDYMDYGLVFFLTLLWLVLVVGVVVWRARRKPISGSLRKEFA